MRLQVGDELSLHGQFAWPILHGCVTVLTQQLGVLGHRFGSRSYNTYILTI